MGARAERVALESLDDVTTEEWEALASRTVFFGHQSVGRNIMDGVREIVQERPEIGLRLVQTNEPAAVEGPAFIDARIGRNREPSSKTEHFAEVIQQGIGAGAIAMYKFCYVDVGGNTDVDALFDAYTARTREIERSHPEITLVHITLPLKTARRGPREIVSEWLGRTTETSLNLRRSRFNERMRAEFAGRAPLFDLARLESTRSDATRSFTRKGSREVEMLAPEWTYDDGHLNEAGRRYVAEQFLVMLARLAATPQGEAAHPADANRASAQFK